MTLFFPQFYFTISCSRKTLVRDYLFSLSSGLLGLIGIAHFLLRSSNLRTFTTIIIIISPYFTVCSGIRT